MNEQNLKYIANLKVQDVPWSRLTTAYGRASEFPKIFEKLARAIEACDAARGLGGEQNLKSEPGAGQNLKSGSGCGQNSTDAARCGAAQNSVNLAQKSESKFKKADNEAAKFKAGGETELKTDAAKCGEAEFKSADSVADKSSNASEREKFDAKALQDVLSKIFNEIEHQSTLWHATPFALLFLARIFMRARAAAGKNANKNNQNAAAGKKQNDAASKNDENENCENEAAGFIAARLDRFFAFMLEICDDADKVSHAAPLASFSDILAEKYLCPQSDENDEERWEEHFYDDELFYSLYFYSRAVLDATGVDFAPFKTESNGI